MEAGTNMQLTLRTAWLCAAMTFATLLWARPGFTADTPPAAALSTETLSKIGAAVTEVLKKTDAPSASIAIVRDGRTVYEQAFGHARLEPTLPADRGMRYNIGSISKQFTASALLMLQQDGKLSLDDKVAKYFPDLTRAGDITIRELLSHTSGYQDCCPQDFAIPEWLEPVTPEAFIERWARKPLNFEPGTTWQYSNTGYVLAGRIVEIASGVPLFECLQQRIFKPLHITSVYNADAQPLGPSDPTGYRRFALGPPRVSPTAGAGWSFGAGGLAMSAADLAKWDISLINQSVLRVASYRALETDTLLANGVGTQYGLGIGVSMENHRRKVSHGGEDLGFTAQNWVYPDERTAIVVLVNQDASSAPAQLSEKVANIVFEQTQTTDDARTAQARAIFAGLQQGQLDRSLFTADANDYFSEQAIADFKASLAPLGPPLEFKQTRTVLRGGMTGRTYDAKFADQTLRVWTYEMPDSKLEQFQVAVKE
jgi:D-alanyl-D-alanine carboxypeptidase